MIEDTSDLLVLALGIIALFVLVMVVGIWLARGAQRRSLGEINAASVRACLGGYMPADAQLLYGVWESSLSEVALVVRDRHDVTLGTISHRSSGTIIEIAGSSFPVVARSGWFERAQLMEPASLPVPVTLCRFAARGWSGNRVASYVTVEGDTFTVSARWAWSRQRAALPILHNAHPVGCIFTLGGWAFNRGRALFLPADIPLPVRLFILWKAVGEQGRSGAR